MKTIPTLDELLASAREVFIAKYSSELESTFDAIGRVGRCEIVLLWDRECVAYGPKPQSGRMRKHLDTLLKERPGNGEVENDPKSRNIGSDMAVWCETEQQRSAISLAVIEGESTAGQPSNRFEELQTLATALGRNISSYIQSTVSLQSAVLDAFHEVNNLLIPVLRSAEYLQEKAEDIKRLDATAAGHSIANVVGSIADTVLLAKNTFANMMHFFSVRNALKGSVKRQRINLNSWMRHIITAYRGLASEIGIDIVCTFDRRIIVFGDPGLLEQLFHNVLGNAVKYSYRPTERSKARFIKISGHQHDPGFREPRVSVVITNYGVGILESEIAHIGERGFRGSLAKQERPLGFGIGVFVAKQIAKLHHGDVRYKSHPTHQADGTADPAHLVECTVVLPGHLEN